MTATETDANRRTLTLDGGQVLSAALVVAADGADSALRGMVGIATSDRDYAQRALVAHVATERPHQATAWQRFLTGATVALLPLADGRSSIVWSVPDAEATRLLALDDAGFCNELGTASDFRLGRITATTPRAAFPLRMRVAERYLARRLALIGDAAHVVHPLAGQGVNLGLRDVACLRRVLCDARKRGSDIGATHVLRRYERERRSENALAARGLDTIERVFNFDNSLAAAVRGFALAGVDRTQLAKQFFMSAAAGRL